MRGWFGGGGGSCLVGGGEGWLVGGQTDGRGVAGAAGVGWRCLAVVDGGGGGAGGSRFCFAKRGGRDDGDGDGRAAAAGRWRRWGWWRGWVWRWAGARGRRGGGAADAGCCTALAGPCRAAAAARLPHAQTGILPSCPEQNQSNLSVSSHLSVRFRNYTEIQDFCLLLSCAFHRRAAGQRTHPTTMAVPYKDCMVAGQRTSGTTREACRPTVRAREDQANGQRLPNRTTGRQRIPTHPPPISLRAERVVSHKDSREWPGPTVSWVVYLPRKRALLGGARWATRCPARRTAGTIPSGEMIPWLRCTGRGHMSPRRQPNGCQPRGIWQQGAATGAVGRPAEGAPHRSRAHPGARRAVPLARGAEYPCNSPACRRGDCCMAPVRDPSSLERSWANPLRRLLSGRQHDGGRASHPNELTVRPAIEICPPVAQVRARV